MMDNDLISRSALLKDREYCDCPSCEDGGDCGFCYIPVEAVKNAPAVDAVEVVRCKNCLHTRERNEYERNYLVEEILICTSPDATDDCWNPVWPNHYCSYGERREDDGNET